MSTQEPKSITNPTNLKAHSLEELNKLVNVATGHGIARLSGGRFYKQVISNIASKIDSSIHRTLFSSKNQNEELNNQAIITAALDPERISKIYANSAAKYTNPANKINELTQLNEILSKTSSSNIKKLEAHNVQQAEECIRSPKNSLQERILSLALLQNTGQLNPNILRNFQQIKPSFHSYDMETSIAIKKFLNQFPELNLVNLNNAVNKRILDLEKDRLLDNPQKTKKNDPQETKKLLDLGKAYENGSSITIDGIKIRVNKDVNVAMECYKKAAEQGHESALESCASCFLKNSDSLENLSIDWLTPHLPRLMDSQRPPPTGDLAATYGYYYEQHDNNDISKARSLYILAATTGSAYAMEKISDWLFEGEHFPKDEKRAFYFLQKAIELNPSTKNLLKLAECYDKGQGVKQDVIKAQQIRERIPDLEMPSGPI